MSSNSKKRKKSETENQQELDRSSSPLPSSSSTPVISSNSHTLSPISPPPSKILKTNNNSSEEEVISDILVFQCHKCYTIVGDSTSYILADKELRTLTLKGIQLFFYFKISILLILSLILKKLFHRFLLVQNN